MQIISLVQDDDQSVVPECFHLTDDELLHGSSRLSPDGVVPEQIRDRGALVRRDQICINQYYIHSAHFMMT